MHAPDPSFMTSDGLNKAVDLLASRSGTPGDLPLALPESGVGEMQALEMLSGHVLGEAAQLGSPTSLAHMDPPTPWITWAMALWDAGLNQNTLHEMTSPFATQAEARVLSWLTPSFGMQGGHFCAGSTIANLTGIWAARDAAGAKTVITSQAAHLSVEKACRLLELELVVVPVDGRGRLSPAHAGKLDGIGAADSVAVSAHKWLFQPKDSALVMFRDLEAANAAVSFGGGYLAGGCCRGERAS